MIILLALLLAADRPVIDLSGGRVQAYPLAMARPLGTQETSVAVQSVVAQDFERSGLFKLLDPASFLAPPTENSFDTRTSTVLRPVCRAGLRPSHGAKNAPPVPLVEPVLTAPIGAARPPLMFSLRGRPVSSVTTPLTPIPRKRSGR